MEEQDTPLTLENRRFAPTAESTTHMKFLRAQIPRVQGAIDTALQRYSN